MAEKVEFYRTADGKLFDTWGTAVRHEEVTLLAEQLDAFKGEYAEDGYDTAAAANWLIETYGVQPK